MPHPSPVRIFEALRAYQETAALKSAIELEVFSAIAEGHTSPAEIAGKTGASERGIRILCDSLATSGFINKSNGRYSNTADTENFLSRYSPDYMGKAAEFLCLPELMEGTLRGLTGSVRKGGTLLEGEGTVNPDNPFWVTFARAMAPMTVIPARAIAAYLPGEGDLRVLDIAASHGMYGIAVAQRNPDAVITALDWAAVLDVARENAAKAGVADRYRTIPGDFFTADLGSDYDAILITNFLHHFDPPTCEGILRKVHAALKPAGFAVTLEFVPDENRLTPRSAAYFPLTMLVTTPHGDAYTWPQYHAMLLNAGFASNRIHLLETEQSVIISMK